MEEDFTRSIIVSESQMQKIREHLFNKYPYLNRKNDAYKAKMIVRYELDYSDKFDADIAEIIK